MKTGNQRQVRSSLWHRETWKQMRTKSRQVPKTLREALLAGYAFNGTGEKESRGGLLNEEFVEGSLILVNEYDSNKLPPLRLPYRARLEFDADHLIVDAE